MKKNYFLFWLLPFLSISFANAQFCPENLGDASTISLVHFKIEMGSCEDYPSSISIAGSVFDKMSCDGTNLKYDLTSGAPLSDPLTFSSEFGFGTCDYLDGELRRQTLSLEDFESTIESVKVYPNPQTDNNDINIAFTKNMSGDINVFDLTGKLVLKDKISNVAHKQVSISTLNNGIYMLQIVADGSSTARKIVIMR